MSKTTTYEHFADKEDLYLHLHATVAEALEAALVASVEETADESDWRARIRHLAWTTLHVMASSRTFLAQPAIEPQIATASARDARRSAAHRNARVWIRLSEELATTTPDVAVIPEHVAIAGMAAGVAVIGAAASDGPDAVRALEDPLTDIWIRLFRAP